MVCLHKRHARCIAQKTVNCLPGPPIKKAELSIRPKNHLY
jgi:hypothetical protein